MPPVPAPKLALLMRPARNKLPSGNKYAIMPALYPLFHSLITSPQLLMRNVFADAVTGSRVYLSKLACLVEHADGGRLALRAESKKTWWQRQAMNRNNHGWLQT